MANLVTLAFCCALIVSLILLIFYVMCLFRNINQLTQDTGSIAAIYHDAKIDSKTGSTDEDGETDTATIIFDFPIGRWIESHYAHPPYEKLREDMSAEELSFFQLPPRVSNENWSSYYKFSVVDELNNGNVGIIGGADTDSVKSNMSGQAEWASRSFARRQLRRNSSMDRRQQCNRRNTWDRIARWMNLAGGVSEPDNRNGARNIVIPDIRIERLSLSETDSMVEDKELLI